MHERANEQGEKTGLNPSLSVGFSIRPGFGKVPAGNRTVGLTRCEKR